MPILILGVPIFDTTLTTVVHIKTGMVKTFGEWIHFTGRDHFHHGLADLGLGEKRAVGAIYLVSIMLGLGALVLRDAWGIDAIFALLQAAIIFLLIAGFMVNVQHRYERLAEARKLSNEGN